MKKKTIIYQHGDVVLVVKPMPDDLTKLSTKVIQEGESTGHAHRLHTQSAEIWEHPKTKARHLRIVEPSALRHEEHKEIMLPPGEYEVRIVREFDHFKEEARRVID